MKKILATLAFIAVTVSPFTWAESTPVMLSTIGTTNLPSSTSVDGVRLAILHGKVNEVTGIDFSLLGLSETNRTTGVNFGVFLGASKVNQAMNGVSIGLLNWNKGQTTGVNLGIVNLTHNVKGLNWSTVNYSTGYTTADIGLASISKKSNFQFGLFNMTDHIDGIQIGLLNCADNGFLKCFPIINFAK